MGILARLLASSPTPWDDYWYKPIAAVSSAGLTINPSTALTISAVYASVRVLAETLAQVPLLLYKRTPEGGKERATDHPLYHVLHDQPNRRQTSFQFREMMMGHAVLRGNAYAQIVPGPRGFADQLIPLHPDRVRTELTEAGEVRYRYWLPNGGVRFFPQDQIFHISTLSDDGLEGLSLISLARDSMGLAKATEEYGSRFFGQGARPRGVLTHPGKVSPEGIAHLKESIKDEFGGVTKSHGVMVLEEGMAWSQIGLNNEDSQFLETRQFEVTDIARWFRIPPHMIGDLTRSTFSNIEEESLNFARFTMTPWFVRWEQAINKDLILDDKGEKIFAEFLMDAFLRGATLARAQANQIYVSLGILTRNEVRIMENRNPLEGLDEPLTPANITGNPPQPSPALPAPAPARGPGNGQARAILLDAAARVVRKEQTAIAKAAKRLAGNPKEFSVWIQEFYAKHAEWAAKTLKISQVDAETYCQKQVEALHTDGIRTAETWLPESAEALVDIMEGSE